ncbi:MAG: helix-turn-helix domain-containing protein [Pyrinomonadaceae bacterium]|nr:helix-turn-helix domain-containing protein [Sphingobacteriaceae bacterium]
MALQTISTHYEPSEFKTIISDCVSEAVKKEIASFIAPSEPQKQILTRQETAELLNISLPTLHDYTKRDIIKAYRLGHKVRYKREDVFAALNIIKIRGNA